MMRALRALCATAMFATLAVPAGAQTTSYVYVANNSSTNTVSGFSVGPTGALTPIGVFPTGGMGTACLVPSEHAVVAAGDRLYVANQFLTGGVASITGFDINPATGTLTPIPGSPFVVATNLPCNAAGGARNTMALAANADGTLLAAATVAGIHMFSIDPLTGALSPVAGSPFAAGSTYTVNMAFSADGQYLTAARQGALLASHILETYAVGGSGTLTAIGSVALPGATSLEYACDGSLLLAGSNTGGGMRTYTVAADGRLTLRATVATTPAPPPASVALSVGDTFAFGSAGNVIHSYVVNADGTLTIVAGSPFANAGGIVTNPTPIAVSGDGSFVFALSFLQSALRVFRIGATGSLTPVATTTGVSGLGSVAAYPARTCDLEPPVTTLTAAPPPNAAGWNNTDVVITLTATDNASGVKEIHYSLSGAQTDSQTVAGNTATFVVSAEGVTEITYFAVDNAGNVEEPKTHTIRIDRTPPTLACSVDRPQLWPPNHKLVPVTATVTVDDGGSGAAGFALIGATSNEPDNGLGDGDTEDDIQGVTIGTDATTVLLRVERSGQGDGRVYTLTYVGADAAGNTGSCAVTVTVPHDRGKK